ncbi:nucleoside hydrolase [Neptunicella marina]|uniref:Nucleoside hydrolase n=1 Tax=Neptunicella marina TaxID=2125989 RepID=A0A8J6IUU3_9ALTE|nr:nucleoside hydrolase [Neptunicella marina]
MSEKIIIDTDPGIDDAMAIFFAFQHPDFDVLGLTTVFGNVPVEMSANNALVLCEMAERSDVPVTMGMSRPLIGRASTYAHFVHGDDGFGNTGYIPAKTELDGRNSPQFIVDMVNKYPGEISLVPIGPLTNIAMAVRLDPSIVSKVKRVVIMGGAAYVPGNVNPVGEANIWNDPWSAQIVFEQDWDVTMIGLDITNKLRYNQEFLDELEKGNSKLGGFVNRISQFYMDFYSKGQTTRDCRFHDVMTLVYILHPEWFETMKAKVMVSCEDMTRGHTICGPEGKGISEPWTSGPYVNVGLNADEQKISDLFKKVYAL